jgi:hypothetical protein
MVKKLFSTIEKIWHRAEDHIEEWRRQDRARNAEAEADRNELWAEAKEREKLLAKAMERRKRGAPLSERVPNGTASSSSSTQRRCPEGS